MKKKLDVLARRNKNRVKVVASTPNLVKMTNIENLESSSVKTPDEKSSDSNKTANDGEAQNLSTFQLFRYANKWEMFLIFVGTLCATASGCLVPATVFIFADMVRSIVDEEFESASHGANATAATMSIMDSVEYFAIGNSIIGIIMIVLIYLSVMLFNYTSQKQAFRIRQLYLRSVLHQDISWYDHKMKSGNVATELTEDIIRFEEGIGEKFAIFIDHVAVLLFSIIFALSYGWQLALVCLASFPITGIVLAVVAKICSALSRKEMSAFSAASSVAQEAISGIKTVVAYNGQNCELERYKKHLQSSYSINAKIGLASGCGFGFLWLGVYTSYALSQWYGIKLILDQRSLPVEEREYDTAVMITVFFCCVIGAMNIGVVSPYIEVFSVSKAAASKIFSVIERRSKINSRDPGGIKPAAFEHSIEFKNVEFRYPSRPNIPILNKLNLKIKKGETVALVGSSGCGKSTCVQLLQRFYDPTCGLIQLDGYDLRDLNIAWLRSNIGIVGQEPVLFDTTIAENIRYGDLDATMEMIVQAAKESNAHDFIMKLPSKYDTLVGEKGAQMSGGQKQRIAIARALVRDPPILLLDEATSALDTRSETKVQEALDKVHKNRTAIIIAHRLSTVRNADRIIVLEKGVTIEEGKHEELMQLQGAYHSLVTAQISELEKRPRNRSLIDAKIEEIDEDLEPITINCKKPDEETSPKQVEKKVGTWKVLKLNRPEWKIIAIASIASVVVGASTPLFAILFGDVVDMLSDPDTDTVRDKSTTYIVYFIIGGIIIGIATAVQIFLLTMASESLTTRLRGFAFGAMLKQEMAWFDEPSNGTGALCAKLSSEAALIKGATGQRIGTIIQSISTILLAIGLSLYHEWRLGLVGIAFIPVIMIVTYLHGRVYKKEALNYQKDLEDSTKIAVEAVSNIRTVVGLGQEETFYNNYVKALTPSFEEAKKNTHYRGFVFAIFKSITCFAYAIVMYYGGILVQEHNVEFSRVYKVAQALITGTVVVGEASAFSPNLQKGVMAASKIIGLIERVPKIRDPKDPEEIQLKQQADIDFNETSFTYSTRPDTRVLDSLNLKVEAGKTYALIGPSGCGKSTVIKLLERFYDPDAGTIAVSGTNIASITQASLRGALGLVEQEPTLFGRSITENIAYGDNTRDVPMDEIISAARKANIHEFVASLPMGYETNLGDKGTMLSGGQKQRVAIARALVRNPKILLLDEATSALDTESEKVVQAALDEAKAGVTCVLIAHRLSTVANADQICVFRQGSIVESGTHEELVRIGGLYYEMLREQNGSK